MKGEKERARRKTGGEEKKAVVALLVFIMATLELLFWPKKTVDAKGPFGGNVFKNPASHINIDKHVHKRIKLFPTK